MANSNFKWQKTRDRWKKKKKKQHDDYIAVVLLLLQLAWCSGGILSLFDIPERHSTKRAEREREKVHRHTPRRNRVPSKSLASIGSPLSPSVCLCAPLITHSRHTSQVIRMKQRKISKQKKESNEIAKAH